MAMGTFDSCEDDPSPGVQGALAIVTGSGQTAPVGSTLSDTLVVQFSPATSGNIALGDVPIEWDVVSGGGSVDSAVSHTSEAGIAVVSWTLGPEAGIQTVTATVRASDPLLQVTFTATATGASTATCNNPHVFQDDFEEQRSWVDTVIRTSSDAVAMVNYEATGGNSGGYRRMLHHFPGGAQEQISVRHIFIEDGFYVPIEQGAVSFLRVTEDRIKFSPTGANQIGTGVIVRKNDVDHIALLTGGVFSNETWQRVTVDLEGSDFSPPVDLSTGAFQFGYLRSNTSAAVLDLTHGIDNWKVEVCR